MGVWGDELLEVFRPFCARVELCQDPNIEEQQLTWREDTCTRWPVKLLAVGQLVPVKGIEFLLRAVAKLVDDGRPVMLDIVGPYCDQAYAGSLHRMQDTLRLNDRVTFHGPLEFGEPLFQAYGNADIHVISSLAEGIPRCIAESRAFCLPVVATAVGGIPSVIRDEQDGLLVPPGDASALAAAIGRVIDDPELRRKMIANGFQAARQSTAEYHAERLARLISETLLDANNAPAAHADSACRECSDARPGP